MITISVTQYIKITLESFSPRIGQSILLKSEVISAQNNVKWDYFLAEWKYASHKKVFGYTENPCYILIKKCQRPGATECRSIYILFLSMDFKLQSA